MIKIKATHGEHGGIFDKHIFMSVFNKHWKNIQLRILTNGYNASTYPMITPSELTHFYINAIRVLWYLKEEKTERSSSVPFCFLEKTLLLESLILQKPTYFVLNTDIDLISILSERSVVYVRFSTQLTECTCYKDKGLSYRAGIKINQKDKEDPYLLNLDSYPIYDKFTPEKCLEYLNDRALSGFASEILSELGNSSLTEEPR